MVRIKSVLVLLALLVALIGYLSLFPFLDPLARWLFPVAVAAGLRFEKTGTAPGERVLTPISVLLFLYYAVGFSMAQVVSAASNLLVVLLAVRMVGEKTGRNYLQIFGLSLFCLSASSLHTLSAQFLFYLLGLLFLLAVSLVVLTFLVRDPETALSRDQLRPVVWVALLLPVASLPIMLALFVLLPRTPYPMWDFLQGGSARQIGFTERVHPGAASTVAAPKNVAFRAVCRPLADDQLYWRGIVLNGFSADSWVRLPLPRPESIRLGHGPVVVQEIYPEPGRTPFLVALDVPKGIDGVRHEPFSDQVFSAAGAPNKRVSYRAYSVLTRELPVFGGIDRAFYLKVPSVVSDRFRREGGALAALASDAAKLQGVERLFRAQKLSYATTGLPVGKEPLDSFLFDKRRGNCEFFAASCAILLRLAGVPARLVGGYHGGSYSAMAGYYLVSDDMAHVWVEAYLEGRGWVQVDPSAWSLGFPSGQRRGVGIRGYLDLLGFYWNRAVITYDLEKQLSLVRGATQKVRGLSLPSLSFSSLRPLLLLMLPAAAIWLLLSLRPASRQERLLRSFLAAVHRRYPEADGTASGLFGLSRQIDDPRLKEFAALYGAALYRDRPLGKGEYRRLKQLVRSLQKHAA